MSSSVVRTTTSSARLLVKLSERIFHSPTLVGLSLGWKGYRREPGRRRASQRLFWSVNATLDFARLVRQREQFPAMSRSFRLGELLDGLQVDESCSKRTSGLDVA